MKAKILPILIVAILVSSGFGMAIGDDIKEGSKEIKKLEMNFSRPEIVDQGEVVKVKMEGAGYTSEAGKPMLPIRTFTEKFPIGTKIVDVKCIHSPIKSMKIEKKIEVAPEPIPVGLMKTVGNEPIEEPKNPFPSEWFDYRMGCGIDDGKRVLFLNIHFYPVKYLPATEMLQFVDHATIKITYEKDYEKSPQAKGAGLYDMVIITPSKFSASLNPLVEHKNDWGLSTKLVTLDEIYNGDYFPAQGRDEQEKIKYFIKNAIEDWDITYILLVGGDDELPIRYTHVHIDRNPPDNEVFLSDLYYADIYNSSYEFCSWDSNENDVFGEYEWGASHLTDDVDLYPDVYLGRLACVNGNEVATAVNKIINYETTDAYAKDWFTNLVVCGGDSFPGDDNSIDEGEFVNEVVIDIMEGFIPERLWATNGRLSGIAPSGASQISSAINAGAGFVDFSGHGNTMVWATHPHENDNKWLPTPVGGYFNSPHISGLSNGEKLPIVIIGGCSCSKFNKDSDCFGWAFVSNPNGGGIATLGATALGYASSGKWVIHSCIEKMAIDTFKAYKQQDAKTFGEMWSKAITNYISPGMDDYDYKTVEEWQPLGDPSLAIAAESEPPEKPVTPSGSSSGKTGTEYAYSSSTTDPDGDEIYYLFNWGDGTYSGWIGSYNSGETVEAKHTWTKKGNYEIKVKAKDEHGIQSEWSDSLPIEMPLSHSLIKSNVKKPKDGYLYIFDREIMPTIFGNTLIIGKITIRAEASAMPNEIEKVEFYIDDVLQHTDSQEPYEWSFDGFMVGRHEIKIVGHANGDTITDTMDVIIFNI